MKMQRALNKSLNEVWPQIGAKKEKSISPTFLSHLCFRGCGTANYLAPSTISGLQRAVHELENVETSTESPQKRKAAGKGLNEESRKAGREGRHILLIDFSFPAFLLSSFSPPAPGFHCAPNCGTINHFRTLALVISDF